MTIQKNDIKEKVALISLGCPKNLIDSEIMLSSIENAEYTLTSDLDIANYIIINTCTFIEEATTESIEKIIEVIDFKKKLNVKIIVAGCMAQRYKEEIFEQFPEVDAIVGTGNIGEIVTALTAPYKSSFVDSINSNASLIQERSITTEKSYAYLRVAEGCNNKCTYCIIPQLRGKYRSRSLEGILAEAKDLIDRGYKELILIAEDITFYGKDKKDHPDLADLISQIDQIAGDFTIRLLYCYPENIDEKLISVIGRSEKVIKYIDIPIQHISDDVLKAMNRRITGKKIKEIINCLREKIPDIIIRTSLIVGFAGETKTHFDELCEFIMEYSLDHVGVFTYSKEEGTPAYKLKDQIPKRTKKERKDKLMSIQKMIVENKNKAMIGNIFSAAIDGTSEDGLFYKGRIYSQAPEIDTITYILGLKDLDIGDKTDIRIINTDGYDLIGEIINESAE